MTQELHYTSAPRGLRPGSVGFCTVGQTAGMPGTLAERLEGLSGYTPVFPPHDPRASLNPVAFSHLRIAIGGRDVSVLSRVGFAGLDYSSRSNKYAHHVVLDANERPPGGPAWLLAQPGFLQDAWEGEPRILPEGRVPPAVDRPPAIALDWGAQAGDPGWAGVLAEAFLADPRKPAYLVFEPGMQILPLFVEALALIPPDRRWEVELSTYFTQLPQGTSCPWRAVLAGSAEAKNARRMPGALVIDLRRPPGEARGGDLVQLARTGRLPDRSKGHEGLAEAQAGAGLIAPPPSSPRLPAPGRPPAVGEFEVAGHRPPRLPAARSVRELEGLGDDSPRLPWIKIALGTAAMLLIALGAGTWFLMPDRAREVIEARQDEAKKAEIAVQEKTQAEAQEKARLDAIAKKDAEQKAAALAAEEKAKAQRAAEEEAKRKQKEDEDRKRAEAKQLAEEGERKKADEKAKVQAEQRVWFLELPPVNESLVRGKKQEDDATIEFPERILPPYEVIQKKIATSTESKQKGPGNKSAELNQLIDGTPPELRIAIPSASLLSSNREVATLSFYENHLYFRWDAAVVNQPRLADLVRDAAIEMGLKRRGDCYLLLRNPKPLTQRISLKPEKGNPNSPITTVDIAWADARSLEDCTWDLVLTDWRIESTLPGEGQEPFTFASMRSIEPKNESKSEIIEGELRFSLSVIREKLTARLHRQGDIAKRKSTEEARQVQLNRKREELEKEIGVLQKGLKSQESEGVPNGLKLDLETKRSSLAKLKHEQEKLAKHLKLYEHYLNPGQVFLDVGIGLRLNKDKVIEIARIGPRWKPNQ